MIDKKYYDILNMITKENIFSKCFEFLEKKGINLENKSLILSKNIDLNDNYFKQFQNNNIGKYYLYIENNDFLLDRTKKTKKINKIIKHFIKNNNFSNEFFEDPICW